MGDSDSSCLVGCTVLIIFGALIGLPATSIVLGVQHLDTTNTTNNTSCPVQPQIPLFLIVLGSITYAYGLISILQACCEKDDQSSCTCLSFLRWLVTFGFIGWVIAGAVWFGSSVDKRSGDPASPNFCNYVLYAYFSSQVILSCVLLLLMFLFGCCWCCSRPGPSTPDPESRSIVNTGLASGRYPTGSRTAIQTTDRLRVVQNGPNLLWVYEQIQVRVVT
ncbi:uncharacterized protein [Amphiura filiformis]|uniref:uncharacterized protein n=1 Tax=Amphiura filiformis TaxID=82378 RepID=UPI003B222FCC